MKKLQLFIVFFSIVSFPAFSMDTDDGRNYKNEKETIVEEAPMEIVILGRLKILGDTEGGDTVVACKRGKRVCMIIQPSGGGTNLKVLGDDERRVLFNGRGTYSVPEDEE